jgi:hypothetical protein
MSQKDVPTYVLEWPDRPLSDSAQAIYHKSEDRDYRRMQIHMRMRRFLPPAARLRVLGLGDKYAG